MIGPALIATMVALAAPTAHGSFTLSCVPAVWGDAAGVTFGTEARVELTNDTCLEVSYLIRHRHASVYTASNGLAVLLHEARHVAQYREGVYTDPAFNTEHDAECVSLHDSKRVLRGLHYRWPFVREALLQIRTNILYEAPPYGGRCP